MLMGDVAQLVECFMHKALGSIPNNTQPRHGDAQL